MVSRRFDEGRSLGQEEATCAQTAGKSRDLGWKTLLLRKSPATAYFVLLQTFPALFRSWAGNGVHGEKVCWPHGPLSLSGTG